MWMRWFPASKRDTSCGTDVLIKSSSEDPNPAILCDWDYRAAQEGEDKFGWNSRWRRILQRWVEWKLILLRLFSEWTGCGRVNGSDFGWKGDLFFGKSYETLEKSAFRWRKNIKIVDCIRQRNTLSKTKTPENIGDRSLLQSIIWKLAWPIWACPITSSDADVNSR